MTEAEIVSSIIEELQAATADDQRKALIGAACAIHRGPAPDDFCRMIAAKAFESAALTLLPPDSKWMISSEEPGPYAGIAGQPCAFMAATPALAIAIAALHAKYGDIL